MKSQGTWKLHPELLVLTTLKFFGSEGNGATADRVKDGLGFSGKGSVMLYVERTVDALLSLESDVVFWPDAEERKEIAARIEAASHFPKCVAFIDGTHMGLVFKLELDGEEYWTRKHQYALNTLVFCDDCHHIRHLVIGWPGSVHDNWIWTNCAVHHDQADFFSEGEYALADSAFTNSTVSVSAYKKLPGAALPEGQVFFNELLSKPHPTVENCIGTLKGRFPYLCNICAHI